MSLTENGLRRSTRNSVNNSSQDANKNTGLSPFQKESRTRKLLKDQGPGSEKKLNPKKMKVVPTVPQSSPQSHPGSNTSSQLEEINSIKNNSNNNATKTLNPKQPAGSTKVKPAVSTRSAGRNLRKKKIASPANQSSPQKPPKSNNSPQKQEENNNDDDIIMIEGNDLASENVVTNSVKTPKQLRGASKGKSAITPARRTDRKGTSSSSTPKTHTKPSSSRQVRAKSKNKEVAVRRSLNFTNNKDDEEEEILPDSDDVNIQAIKRTNETSPIKQKNYNIEDELPSSPESITFHLPYDKNLA